MDAKESSHLHRHCCGFFERWHMQTFVIGILSESILILLLLIDADPYSQVKIQVESLS